MKIKIPAIIALAAALCALLSGCFGMYAPQPTSPPQAEFGSVADFAGAVAKARADTTAEDAENLKGLTGYYQFQSLPDGAAVTSVMVSTEAVRMRYAFGAGPVSEDSFENQMELGWYRNADTGTFLSNMAQSMSNSGVEYDTIESDGITYIHMVPIVTVVVTPQPGDTAAATPTPQSTTYCQILYWVQDGGAFVAALPLGFTNDDIVKYCHAERVALVQ
jgi:hypothetical protein